MILAGIITYNPDMVRLEENVSAISPQVDRVLIVDNNSANIADIATLISGYRNVALYRNVENVGVAKALNQQAEYCVENNFEWLLHLDQDTVASESLVSEYLKYIQDDNIGILCCKVIDRNAHVEESNTSSDVISVKTCITSGTFLRITAWKKTSGYCNVMFIDAVDHDFCLTIREAGYKILCVNSASILHEVGNSEVKKSFGKTRIVYNEKPFRHYYHFRNYILMNKRHWNTLSDGKSSHIFHCIYVVINRIFFINLYEHERMKKDIMILRGIYHGIIGKYGRLNN